MAATKQNTKDDTPVEGTEELKRQSLYVSVEVVEFVDRVAEETGHSKIQIMDYIISLHRPEDIAKKMKKSNIAIRRPGRQKGSIFDAT
jgi:hypothetical protein